MKLLATSYLKSVKHLSIVFKSRVKLSHVLWLYRLGRWRLQLQRVDGRAVLPDAEIKMRTGRKSGGTDIADDISLTDPHAGLYAFPISGKVHVGCSID